MKKKDKQSLASWLMSSAVLAVGAAGWGFFFADFILASTQWLLVAIALSIFGLYLRTTS